VAVLARFRLASLSVGELVRVSFIMWTCFEMTSGKPGIRQGF
jgi:hypothetical protein